MTKTLFMKTVFLALQLKHNRRFQLWLQSLLISIKRLQRQWEIPRFRRITFVTMTILALVWFYPDIAAWVGDKMASSAGGKVVQISEGDWQYQHTSRRFSAWFGDKSKPSAAAWLFEAEPAKRNPIPHPARIDQKIGFGQWLKERYLGKPRYNIAFSLQTLGYHDTSQGGLLKLLTPRLEKLRANKKTKVDYKKQWAELMGQSSTPQVAIDPSATEANDNQVLFINQTKDFGVLYTILPNQGVKEEILMYQTKAMDTECMKQALAQSPHEVFARCPLPPNTFTFSIQADPGVQLLHTADNTWYFADSKGRYLGHFANLIATDSTGATTNRLNLQLLPGSTQTEASIQITLDLAWLMDPARSYPIQVDPSIIYDESSDFANGIFNRSKDTGSGASPKVETFYQELPADQGTVGLWHLNEGTGIDANDSSGSGNNGTLVNSPTWQTAANSQLGASALAFNGTSQVVSLGTNSVLRQTQAITYEFWAYMPSGGGGSAMGVGATGGHGMGGIILSPTGFVFSWTPSGPLNDRNVSASFSLVPDTWHHVAFSIDYLAQMYHLLIDGNNYNLTLNNTITGSWTPATSYNSGQTDYLGGRSVNSLAYFNGRLDEIRVSNRFRAQDELKGSALRRPASTYDSGVLDLGLTVNTLDTVQWTENGVQTGDAETVFSTTNLIARWGFNDTNANALNNAGASTCGGNGLACDISILNFSSPSCLNTPNRDVCVTSGWTDINKRWGAGALMVSSASTADYLSFGTDASIYMDPGTLDFTIMGWIKTNTLGPDTLWNNNNDGGDGCTAMGVHASIDSSGYLSLDLHNGTSCLVNNQLSGRPITDGIWHNWVWTVDRDVGSYLYIDGVQASFVGINDATSITPAGLIEIGTSTAVGDADFMIDAMAYYNRYMPFNEVLANYNVSNIQFQTRTGTDNTPDDGGWEVWAPTTGETQLTNLNTNAVSWEWRGNQSTILRTDSVFPKAEGRGSLKVQHNLASSQWQSVGQDYLYGNTYGTNVVAADPTTGYVFIGTDTGLVYWDGNTMQVPGMSVHTTANPPLGTVLTLAISGTKVYVGGSFNSVSGNTNCVNICVWNIDTATWSALGSGLSSANIYTITLSGSNVYVAGSFTDAGGNANCDNICLWNGSSWTGVGTGLASVCAFTESGCNDTVYASTISGGNLYVGGSFEDAGGVTTCDILCVWNGSTWSGVGSGLGLTSSVRAMTSIGSNVYIGGNFTDAGGNSNADNIGYWNGSNWNNMGTGVNNTVYSLSLDSNNLLYVGGEFTTAGGSSAFYLTTWNGSTWGGTLGSGPLGAVLAIAPSPVTGYVYASGNFDDGGASNMDAIAEWDGSDWNPIVMYPTNAPVKSISFSDIEFAPNGDLYAVGTGGGRYWNGSVWNYIGSSVNQALNSFAVGVASNNYVYVGGSFTDLAGNTNCDRICYWNGSSWNALGTGVSNSAVTAIAISGSNIYIGGSFTDAGGNANCDRICFWNGAAWTAMNTGLSSTVSAISISGSNVYVGGSFTDAGGVTAADRIAYWNGSAWNALGTGVANNAVTEVVAAGSAPSIYIGGNFTDAGGNTNCDRICFWNGSAWTAMSTGLNNTVSGLAVSGSNVYVAGSFTDAGGVADADRAAYWNGSAWVSMGIGLAAGAANLAVSPNSSAVYFAGPGIQSPFGNIAKFDHVVGEWHLDEVSGSGAYIHDTSGYANHGTPSGTAVANGVIGKARTFNGTSDRITVPATTGKLDIDAVPVTLEAWVKTNAISGTAQEIVTRGTSGANGYGMHIAATTGLVNCGSHGGSSFSSAMALTANTWYHLVCILNGSASGVYINGVLSSTGSVTVPAGTNELIIGADWNGSVYQEFFNGLIDEVRVSNIARTSSEIAESYRMGRDKQLTLAISSSDLTSSTAIPFWIAADRPGTFLSLNASESTFANYEIDANTMGLWHFDNLAQSAAPVKSTGTGANLAGIGTVAWGTPTNIGAADNAYATAALNNQTSNYLRASNFGFTLSDAAVIRGIEVRIERRATTANQIRDNRVRIVNAQATIGSTAKETTTFYPTIDTIVTYGSETDQWGLTWSARDVNDTDFGVVLSSVNTVAAANTVSVDHISVTLYYSDPPVVDESGQANFGYLKQATRTAGILGQALNFDGTDDYVSALDADSLSPTNITLETWIRFDTLGSNDIIAGKGAEYWLAYNFTTLGCSANRLGFAVWNGSAWTCASSTFQPVINQWYYVVGTYDGSNIRLYLNGQLNGGPTAQGTPPANGTQAFSIGAHDIAPANNFDGTIDEVRLSNSVRTAQEIRQAYESVSRAHPITIDFTAKLDSGNLIANSADTSFTVNALAFGASDMGGSLYPGETIIIKENVSGIDYIAQGTVTAVTASSGAVTVGSWQTGSTFPSGGYSINASVFKWQREFFDLSKFMTGTGTGDTQNQRNALTKLSLRILDNNHGASVWLDDLRHTSSYLTTPAGSTITSPVHRYAQTRAVISSSDPAVSSWLSLQQLNFSESPANDLLLRHGKWFTEGQKQPFWWAGEQGN